MLLDHGLPPNCLAYQATQLPAAWREVLATPTVAQAFAAVTAYVEQRLAQGAIIYPATPFRALDTLLPAQVRVVILGQDPYHGPGQAQGLAFSVPEHCKRPPSLRNIFAEIAREHPDAALRIGNDLSFWAQQGVLLLNTTLTVEAGQPAAHTKRGWETVTDALITRVAQDPSPKVFMLWGAHAQAKQGLLRPQAGHLQLISNHPSPLSAHRAPMPFLGCGHFQHANAWLIKQGENPINWCGNE